MKLWEEPQVVWAQRLSNTIYGTAYVNKTNRRYYVGIRDNDWDEDIEGKPFFVAFCERMASLGLIAEAAYQDLIEDLFDEPELEFPRTKFASEFVYRWSKKDEIWQHANGDDLETMKKIALEVINEWKTELIQEAAA